MARKTIHFLHIGKCAGTQLKLICDQVNSLEPGVRIVYHNHWVRLVDLTGGDPYFFSIRDPFTRFVSGFYSRKRKGQPRKLVEWTAHEAQAFGIFEHANDLAESLFQSGELGIKAFSAMKSILHTAQNQSDWFTARGFFLYRRPPIWIVRQECFDTDLKVLLDRAGLAALEPSIKVSSDRVSAHMNDYSGIPDLSPKARKNLRIWYAQDFEVYRACSEWIKVNSTV